MKSTTTCQEFVAKHGNSITWLIIFLIISIAIIAGTYSANLWAPPQQIPFQLSLQGCNPNVTYDFSGTITAVDINNLLWVHNEARRMVIPKASIMPPIKWNTQLAVWAQKYENSCPGLVHSSDSARTNVAGFAYIGENLAAGYDSWASAAQAWVNERAYFTYPTTCATGKVCGHYTQVIWASSTDVGCGYSYCPSLTYKRYYRCVYGPGGNYVGEAPYIVSKNATDVAPCSA